jgi:hypothetical protein
MAGLESLYTPQKVYRPLADVLDIARDAEEAHYDRYSVQDGSGIESQVARHCALYPNDPDVAAYRELPSSAFDSPSAGIAHGIRWLSLADIHHSLTDRRPVVAVVVIGRTVFFRVELSAVERQIQRADGGHLRHPGGDVGVTDVRQAVPSGSRSRSAGTTPAPAATSRSPTRLLQFWIGSELCKTVARTSRGEVRKKRASVPQLTS